MRNGGGSLCKRDTSAGQSEDVRWHGAGGRPFWLPIIICGACEGCILGRRASLRRSSVSGLRPWKIERMSGDSNWLDQAIRTVERQIQKINKSKGGTEQRNVP